VKIAAPVKGIEMKNVAVRTVATMESKPSSTTRIAPSAQEKATRVKKVMMKAEMPIKVITGKKLRHAKVPTNADETGYASNEETQ
jgi:hypothetical protein